ncbi:MAG TPA: GNAT family N-acetyltransferase [Parvularculaceae bacterium]|nr:GNAT family N-acetyltransferase [Caulobacterales bacterium]HPE32362.1 GNAT family N-acetyltransferase [Parvularculaceae bacterium]HRX39588.1 GNAT family N-acetyltransferase [Parvularculaceae bacterium]
MSETIVIRPATKEDASVIHDMVVALARDTGKMALVTSSVEDIARDGFGAAPAFEALIAEKNGAPVGLALFFPEYSTWRGRRGVYLQDLFVDGSVRGEGVGAKLIAALAARGARDGAVYMRLAVDDKNDSAAKFYDRLGFVEHKEDRMLFLDHGAFADMAKR